MLRNMYTDSENRRLYYLIWWSMGYRIDFSWVLRRSEITKKPTGYKTASQPTSLEMNERSVEGTPTITPNVWTGPEQPLGTQQSFNLCWFNVGSTSATLSQHYTNVGWTPGVLREVVPLSCSWMRPLSFQHRLQEGIEIPWHSARGRQFLPKQFNAARLLWLCFLKRVEHWKNVVCT